MTLYGFGILMYRFGSKKALLEDFASTELTDCGVVSTLAEILWEQQLKTIRISSTGRTSNVQKPSSFQSMEDLLAFLDGNDAKENDCFVYVFIHNINGPGLRDNIGRKIWKTKAYVNRTYRASQ
ncbi:hypothetical protein C5167_026420, partial [Papaver somniferum]